MASKELRRGEVGVLIIMRGGHGGLLRNDASQWLDSSAITAAWWAVPRVEWQQHDGSAAPER